MTTTRELRFKFEFYQITQMDFILGNSDNN